MIETIDLTPNTQGLLNWIRHVAKTDRPLAMRLLVEGWPMTEQQATAILHGWSPPLDTGLPLKGAVEQGSPGKQNTERWLASPDGSIVIGIDGLEYIKAGDTDPPYTSGLSMRVRDGHLGHFSHIPGWETHILPNGRTFP